jgi:DNA-binding MarR family transcriptional regulator
MPQFRPKPPALGPRPPESGPAQAPEGPLSDTKAQAASPRGAAIAPAIAPATAPAPAIAPATAIAPEAPKAAGPSPIATARTDLANARANGAARLRHLRDSPRPFLHMPTLNVPSRSAVESAARELLSGPVEAARVRLQNPRELSDRIAMGRAIWRDLVIGFAAQLGELNLGFTQLAALYALADSGTMTVADLADTLGRSQSAASRLVDGLVTRQLIERNQDSEDRRQRTLKLTGRGQALLGLVDRARAQEFLSIVRPLPTAERAVVAMGVAALSTHAMTRRGHLIKQRTR